MAKQFRKLDQFAMSLGDKEATYDAGPAAWTLGAAFQQFEFGDAFVQLDDQIVSDRDTVHGSQFATATEIIRKDMRMAFTLPRLRPTDLAGLAALAGGDVASVQDGAFTGWRHKATPVAANVALPSIGVQEKASGEQLLYTGVKCDTFSLKRAGPYWSLDVGLIGSGTRGSSATAFPAKVSETPFRWGNAYCWLETGGNISIDAAPTQGAENISSATPDILGAGATPVRLLDVEFRHGNDLQADDGYCPGSGLVRGRLDHGEGRGAHIRVVALVDPATLAAERAYYDNQDHVAIEVEVDSGVKIDAGGAYKYGFDLIIPRLHLAPVTRGVQGGVNIITFEGDCMDDGTLPLWQLYVYNAQVAYLA